MHLRAVGGRGWRASQGQSGRVSKALLGAQASIFRGGPGGDGSDRNQGETRRGDEASWAPASYLSSWSLPGPPQHSRPSLCLVPAAGSCWAACLQCWLSSPGSCCWSWTPWSAGAAAQGREHPGPYRQAGEAGWGGAEGQRSGHQPAPLPFSFPPPSAPHAMNTLRFTWRFCPHPHILSTRRAFRACGSLWFL